MGTLSKKHCKILVVDDEPMVSASIKLMLKHYGHEARVVGDGETAITLCKAERFDLVITDYYMPDMKGDELSAAIKRDWPEQKILMISAFGAELLARGNPLDGVDHVLSKPFSSHELLMAIAEAIG
jgi:CheY-like chemotaxis protein